MASCLQVCPTFISRSFSGGFLTKGKKTVFVTILDGKLFLMCFQPLGSKSEEKRAQNIEECAASLVLQLRTLDISLSDPSVRQRKPKDSNTRCGAHVMCLDPRFVLLLQHCMNRLLGFRHHAAIPATMYEGRRAMELATLQKKAK